MGILTGIVALAAGQSYEAYRNHKRKNSPKDRDFKRMCAGEITHQEYLQRWAFTDEYGRKR